MPSPRRSGTTQVRASATSSAPNRMLPAAGFCNPASSLSKVLLPQPDGPSKASVVPPGTSRSISASTVWASNDSPRPRTEIAVPAAAALCTDAISERMPDANLGTQLVMTRHCRRSKTVQPQVRTAAVDDITGIDIQVGAFGQEVIHIDLKRHRCDYAAIKFLIHRGTRPQQIRRHVIRRADPIQARHLDRTFDYGGQMDRLRVEVAIAGEQVDIG